MHWTGPKPLGKSSWTVPAISLAMALLGGVCVPGLAQLNMQKVGQEGADVFGPSGTFRSLTSFDYTDGAVPVMELVQGTDGNFYGPAYKGGTGANPECTNGCGTIFKITSAGILTTAHTFDETDGFQPVGLLQGTDGNYYGTANYGGTGSCISYGFTGGGGTVFKMASAGTLTTLHNFCSQRNSADGAIPWGTMVQGTDGNFYGTTIAGGTGTCRGPVGPGCGTVFKITPDGTLTTFHSFHSTDGAYPYGGVLQAVNGNFYGTTSEGGAHGYGTIFEITPAGTLTTLHSFDGSDGAYPSGGLVQAANGNFMERLPGTPRSPTEEGLTVQLAGSDGVRFLKSLHLVPSPRCTVSRVLTAPARSWG